MYFVTHCVPCTAKLARNKGLRFEFSPQLCTCRVIPPGNPGPTRDRKMGGEILLGKEEFIKTKSPGSGACQRKLKLKLTLSNAPVTAKPLPPTPPQKTYITVQK